MTAEVVPYSPKLALWCIEAFAELGLRVHQIDANYALLPQRLVRAVEAFDPGKVHDICFIGALRIDPETDRNRGWIVDYIRQNFTDRCYLQFTDAATKAARAPMGVFDHTLERDGFVPKAVDIAQRNAFDPHYYQVMRASRFTLCPAGDANWSLRFYEALMCRSIPILRDAEGFRTAKEAALPYHYITAGEPLVWSEAAADRNYDLFLRHHTLRHWRPPVGKGAPPG